MDAANDPTVERIVFKTSAQVGKTEIINNIVGYHIDVDPCPILVVNPTLEMSDTWSKDRLTPMLRDTPALEGKVSDEKSRNKSNTTRHKTFPGGHITMAGANSPASLAGRPVRIVLMDEVDRMPASAGTEGDPVSLARKRTRTFWNKKIIAVSTPTIAGMSRIETAFNESDQRHAYVPCPDCGEHQILNWQQVVWEKDEEENHLPETAAYSCVHCGTLWSDVVRWAAVRFTEWRAHAPFNGTRGYTLNEIYSSWVTLTDMVKDFIEAKRGGPQTLKTFINTSLALVWEDIGERADEDDLMKRREEFGEGAPSEVAIVTAGVDIQDNRIEVEKVGWGRDEESWSLEHVILHGDPSTPEIWQALETYLQEPVKHQLLGTMRVHAACVDTGGHYTQKAYLFCRDKFGRNVWAIKGRGGEGIPIWPKRFTKKNKQNCPLFIIGVDAAKETIYARLNLDDPGPGYSHFPKSREKEYFKQLTAEEKKEEIRKGRRVRFWAIRPGRKRNEGLDLRVYAYAALQGLIMNRRMNLNSEAKFVERRKAKLVREGKVFVPQGRKEKQPTTETPVEIKEPPKTSAKSVVTKPQKNKRRRTVARSNFLRR